MISSCTLCIVADVLPRPLFMSVLAASNPARQCWSQLIQLVSTYRVLSCYIVENPVKHHRRCCAKPSRHNKPSIEQKHCNSCWYQHRAEDHQQRCCCHQTDNNGSECQTGEDGEGPGEGYGSGGLGQLIGEVFWISSHWWYSLVSLRSLLVGRGRAYMKGGESREERRMSRVSCLSSEHLHVKKYAFARHLYYPTIPLLCLSGFWEKMFLPVLEGITSWLVTSACFMAALAMIRGPTELDDPSVSRLDRCRRKNIAWLLPCKNHYL